MVQKIYQKLGLPKTWLTENLAYQQVGLSTTQLFVDFCNVTQWQETIEPVITQIMCQSISIWIENNRY